LASLPFLFLAADAFARAGGGSNGKGGGGIVTLILLPFFILYAWYKNKRIRDKNAQAEQLLEKLAKTDPAWEESRVLAAAAKIFLAVQKAWCDQDLPGLRDLLEDDVYAIWEKQVTDLQAKGWTNKMDRLTVRAMRVVEVQNFKERDKDTFTVCVDAAAEDYSVDRSGVVVESNSKDDDKRNAKKKSFEDFREFWSYRRHGDGWKLMRLDEDGEWSRTVNAPLVDEA
jgi:predicted lipid-binding transport protein (Tim44 family)